MSGLVGWIDFRRDLTAQESVLRAMTDTMRGRGPDDAGKWFSRRAAIGHRSLATSAAGGKQPVMAEVAGHPVVLSHAGCIDNIAGLRSAVGATDTQRSASTDAEVLLAAYLRWGIGLVERLDGMFALAVWDGRTDQLLLARDRLGVKPLYYHEYPGGMLFASEPKGIVANPLFKAELDLSALPILLQPRLALPGETPLNGLREVPPAHTITYSQAGRYSRRYWALTSAPHERTFEQTAQHVRGLLEDIVARQLTCDVALGAMLSGGVDSTSIAALAAKGLRTRGPANALDTFCVQFESDPQHFVPTELRPEVDAPYAALAATYIGSRHRTVTATTNELLEAVPQTRRARDLPGWGQFDASMYLLFREMKKHCSVALTGEAADEIFGGYPYFFKPELIQRDHFPWLGDGPKLSDYLSRDVLARVDTIEDERSRYSQLLSQVPRLAGESREEARMREVLYLGMSGPLAVILDRKDRMSMSLGLEVRVPFCDHRLVEYVWNVPWTMKSSRGIKGVLKAAMADLLPASTLDRKKSAYPHIHNPAYDSQLIREAMSIVDDQRSPVARMFDATRLKTLIQEIEAKKLKEESLPGGVNPAHMLIHLVEISRWIHDYRVSVH
jgi:asparagine synthase (glutamine-hydrolysing)